MGNPAEETYCYPNKAMLRFCDVLSTLKPVKGRLLQGSFVHCHGNSAPPDSLPNGWGHRWGDCTHIWGHAKSRDSAMVFPLLGASGQSTVCKLSIRTRQII